MADQQNAARGRTRLRVGPLDRSILSIAAPAMLTNLATALFGVADLWVIGRLGDPAAQGAVEVGAKLLTTLFVVVNFLRTSTIALTAQASGRGAEAEQGEILARALAIAVTVGVLMLAGMPVIVQVGLQVFGARGDVADLARTYVQIRYWSGVPWLLSAVLTGLLVGRRRVREILVVEVSANLVHIMLDVVLVLGFGLGVRGVAAASLSSEIGKFIALAALASREAPARRILSLLRKRRTWAVSQVGQVLRLNRDLFGRTVLLMAAIALLTRAGAQQGATVLAANAVIYQLFMLATLVLDGFESAAQVLCGHAVGARDRRGFDSLVVRLFGWAGVTAVCITLVYAVAGRWLAGSFSIAPTVVAAVDRHLVWAVILPLAGVASYVLDGIFIGAGWTRAMLVSMAAASAGYVALLYASADFGNHGLWFAFTVFLLLRAAGQLALAPRLRRRSFVEIVQRSAPG